jgi:hypothetical protein
MGSERKRRKQDAASLVRVRGVITTKRTRDMNTTKETNGGTNGHRVARVQIRPAKVTKHPETVEVFMIEKEVIQTMLVGTSSLIVNNFSEKSVTEMEDNRRLSAEEKRALKKAPKPPVVPEEKYMAARILDEEGRDCVPARWIKAALVTAAQKYGEIGVNGQIVRGALFVLGDLIPIRFKGVKPWADVKPWLGETKIGTYGLPTLRRDVVRVGKFPNKQPDLRYRPEYRDWSLQIQIEYEPSLISLPGLHHLIRRAGSSVGLCEWRPEKSPAGLFGRFDIAAGIEARARS